MGNAQLAHALMNRRGRLVERLFQEREMVILPVMVRHIMFVLVVRRAFFPTGISTESVRPS